MLKGPFNNRSSLDLVPRGVSPRRDRPLVNPRGSPQFVNLVPRGVSPRRDRPLVWPLVVVFWLLMAGSAGALEFEVQQIRFGLEDISHPALKPQGWLFTGRVGGSLSGVAVGGPIR